MINQIFAHSCEKMLEIGDNLVSLTVTSPPYWNAIDYDIHANDHTQYYRTRKYSNGYHEYEDYQEWLGKSFNEVFRVTKPGGFCVVVIGTVLHEGRHFPVPFDFTSNMIKNNWEFHQDIIWHKCTAGVKRAGVSIQKPFPGYFYPNIMTEYILVFKKPGQQIYKDISQEKKDASAYPINKIFTMDIANNIWHIAPVPPGLIDHPCPFPEEIPYRLISLYSYKNDLILDPFVGSGQTLKVAHYLNRNYVGYEIIQKYVDLSQKRIEEPPWIREQQLVVIFEKINNETPIFNNLKEPKKENLPELTMRLF